MKNVWKEKKLKIASRHESVYFRMLKYFFRWRSIQLRRNFFIIEDDFKTFLVCALCSSRAEFLRFDLTFFCYRWSLWVNFKAIRIDNDNELFGIKARDNKTARYDKSKFSIVQLAQHIAEPETGILIVSDTCSFTRLLHLMLLLLVTHIIQWVNVRGEFFLILSIKFLIKKNSVTLNDILRICLTFSYSARVQDDTLTFFLLLFFIPIPCVFFIHIFHRNIQ